jgi:hypothetical protein
MNRRGDDVTALGAGSVAAAGDITNVSTRVGDSYGVEALPLAMARLDYSLVLADVEVSQFIGREWIYRQIDESLHAPGCAVQGSGQGSYVLIGARAGLGKTALAAWLSQQWGCVYHCTRASGGTETRAALQSLAAQLVTRYRLEDDFAPGGMLPGWVSTPAHFPKVLAAAARRALDEGITVRIVIDALDEAQGDGPALGLPALLPNGVEIIATYRDGIPAERLPAGGHIVKLHIDANDPGNRDDIERFLHIQAKEKAIAARLSVANISADQFVSLLVRRSDGVWIYLRYVLSQIRLGTWNVAALESLPAGLVEYYRQHITARLNEPLFSGRDLLVLSTLAVANQPMTLDQLTRLTGLDIGVVRGLCNKQYLPFLAINVAANGPPSYSVYHASLREFLRGASDSGTTEHDIVELNEAYSQ